MWDEISISATRLIGLRSAAEDAHRLDLAVITSAEGTREARCDSTPGPHEGLSRFRFGSPTRRLFIHRTIIATALSIAPSNRPSGACSCFPLASSSIYIVGHKKGGSPNDAETHPSRLDRRCSNAGRRP